MTQALILDCDGVLAETEQEGHLPSFNEAFAEFGLPIRWSEADYGELLRIGGGKERIASVLTPEIHRGIDSDGGDDLASLIARLHRRKSEIFREKVVRGDVPARSGVRRLIEEAFSNGWQVAVASTSARESVEAVLQNVVGHERAAACHIFAGDIVPRKKPDPAIYLRTLDVLKLRPPNCVVVEDSGIGCRAAVSAGLATVVTKSAFTQDDDFSGAAFVTSDLGDPGHMNGPADGGSHLTLERIARIRDEWNTSHGY